MVSFRQLWINCIWFTFGAVLFALFTGNWAAVVMQTAAQTVFVAITWVCDRHKFPKEPSQ